MNIAENWVYKPMQLIEAIHEKKTGQRGISVFQHKTLTILSQALTNNIKRNEKEIDETGAVWYKISLNSYLDKMGYCEDDIKFVASEIKKIPSLVSTIKYKNNSFRSFSIIPEIDVDLDKRVIKFKVASLMDYIFRNNFVILTDETPTHAKSEKGEDLFRYARIHEDSFKHIKDKKLNRTLVFYEYLIENRFLNEEGKYIKIDIDRFKELLFCENYVKNSEILNRILKPMIENLSIYHGLDVYYKCELEGKYKRISSISFEVFVQDNDIGNKLHQTSETQNLVTKKEVYFGKRHTNILNFKTQEELNMMIELGYTNVPYREIKYKVCPIYLAQQNEILRRLILEIKKDELKREEKKKSIENAIEIFFNTKSYDVYKKAMIKLELPPIEEYKFKAGLFYEKTKKELK